jgi:hypothetical protein
MKKLIVGPCYQLRGGGRAQKLARCGLLAAATLSSAACTLSNTSEGGAEGLEGVVTRRDRPSDQSVERFFDPGSNLLAALTEVEAADADVLTSSNIVVGEMLNEVGEYYSAAIRFQPGGAPYVAETDQCENSTLPDAVDTLCANLADEGIQLVFIDETPHFAQHRVLGRRLLECARAAGFEYLVIEALLEDGAALAARGYVSRTESGPYVREPQFAGLIEEGLALGFTPIGLPAGAACSECTLVQAFSQNSEEKADSLIAQTLTVNPGARVLVWTGPGQAFEQPWGPRPFVNSLASYVFSKTGIDPYTLTQVTLDPSSSVGPLPASGMYLATGPANGGCSGSYSPGSATGLSTHDGVVVHVAPRGGAQGSDDDRWDWLHAPASERMSVTTQCASCQVDQRLLVQAFPVGVDVATRVPTDQALCAPSAACELVLPAGAYQVVVWSDTAQLASVPVDLSAGTAATINAP